MRKAYTHPPQAIYNIAKRKERLTKAISLLQSIKQDEKELDLEETICDLKIRRQQLDIL